MALRGQDEASSVVANRSQRLLLLPCQPALKTSQAFYVLISNEYVHRSSSSYRMLIEQQMVVSENAGIATDSKVTIVLMT